MKHEKNKQENIHAKKKKIKNKKMKFRKNKVLTIKYYS